jgi:hypothetical protein
LTLFGFVWKFAALVSVTFISIFRSAQFGHKQIERDLVRDVGEQLIFSQLFNVRTDFTHHPLHAFLGIQSFHDDISQKVDLRRVIVDVISNFTTFAVDEDIGHGSSHQLGFQQTQNRQQNLDNQHHSDDKEDDVEDGIQ